MLGDVIDHDLLEEFEDRGGTDFVDTDGPLRVCFYNRNALVQSIKVSLVHLDPV